MSSLTHRKTRIFLLSAALLLLMGGGALYLLYRPHVLLLHVLMDHTPFVSFVDYAHQFTVRLPLPCFVVYNLPGAMWSMAYILVSESLFLHLPYSHRLGWASVVPLMGGVSEMMQAFHFLPGHFDWLDFWCYLLPYLIYALLTFYQKHAKK